jgi:FixJ family two-component response regulator
MERHSSGSKSLAEIFVLEEEHGVREMLSMILTKADYEVVCFADSRAFLAAARMRIPACILLDIFVADKSGLELLKELREDRYPAPIIMISGCGDVAMAVSAMKLGALDFIEKPFQCGELLARVTGAIEFAERQRQQTPSALGSLYFPGAKPLSKREREVLEQFISGASTKEVARALGISPRTVEDHRSHIMGKLRAKSYADLVRIVMSASRHSSRR